MSKSTRSPRARKAPDRPKKPYPDFPLYPHPLGYWSKKILGKFHYFGRWARVVDGKLTPLPYEPAWKEALEAYKVQADDLHAGRTPRASADTLTVADLCNHFLTAKLQKLNSRELGTRMFGEYRQTTDLLVAAFGANRAVEDLNAGDFQQLRARMATRWGPTRLANAITRVKSVFKYGYDNGLLAAAVRYGSEFTKPGKATMRRHKAGAPAKMFEAHEVRRLLEGADPQLRCMILLGINTGLGNHDIATLPLSALDLDAAWLTFARPKTGVARRAKLWPETVEAIGAVMETRPEPAGFDAVGRVFLTARGTALVRNTEKSRTDNISLRFANLLDRLGLRREGVGFYSLRSTYRTIADAARDPVAVDLTMGHADHTMGGRYRQRVEDGRLEAVAAHVRAWVFDGPGQTHKR